MTLKKTSFWQLEIIVIAMPMIIFTTYVCHVQGKQLRAAGASFDKKKFKKAMMDNHVEENLEACFDPRQVFPGPGPTDGLWTSGSYDISS